MNVVNIDKKNHPDFIFIKPLLNSSLAREQIQIFQIRECIWKLSLKSLVAPFKIALIDQAHYLNQDAQSALLKTLEEPKGKTLLILISEYPEFLFPTIRSRCEILKFYPLPKEEISAFLKLASKEKKLSEKEIEELVEISQGKPGIVIDFLNQPQKLKKREKLIRDIIKISNSDLVLRFNYAQKISKSPELKEIVNIWLSYFRKNLIYDLNSQQSFWKIEKLVNILKNIQETFFLISTTNVNPRLALEILMLEL